MLYDNNLNYQPYFSRMLELSYQGAIFNLDNPKVIENKDALLEIVNNQAVTEEQKQNAVDALVRLTEVAQMEADAEMLLEAKGFDNVVVSINDNCCDVVLDMGEDTESARAQVEDVIKRKTDITAENIVITPLSTE